MHILNILSTYPSKRQQAEQQFLGIFSNNNNRSRKYIKISYTVLHSNRLDYFYSHNKFFSVFLKNGFVEIESFLVFQICILHTIRRYVVPGTLVLDVDAK